MLNEVGSAADHEARNECLIEIDEAWENCRDTVDLARITLEETLEASRAVFEEQRRHLSERHRADLEEAWTGYKQISAESPLPNRKERVANASATYKQAADKIHEDFHQSMAAAQAQYAGARNAAIASYESDVEGAYSLHHDALQNMSNYFEAGAAAAAAAASGEAGVGNGLTENGATTADRTVGAAADEPGDLAESGTGTAPADYGDLYVRELQS